MIRNIIHIDKEKCNGCGLCTEACHEGAIGISDGKARLLREDYCDGLGNCLPVCPTGALTFEEREAKAYDKEEEVEKMNTYETQKREVPPGGCPGSNAKKIERGSLPVNTEVRPGQLMQWPIQIKLVPVKAPYFENANLLVSADCGAYAYGNFHKDFIRNRIALIGCPKLDEGDYSEKITEIIKQNNIKSITVIRMEVPCCGGIEQAVINALKNTAKMIPWRVVTLSINGDILSD